jgi:DNA polymerase
VPVYSIDFETRSEVDLTTAGVHVYAQHSSTRVLCMAWRKDDEPVKLWRSGVLCIPEAADPFPQEVIDHILVGGRVMAHNAAFERQLWTHVLRKQVSGLPDIKTEQWYCTMAAALACGLPAGLDALAAALGGTIRKDMTGYKAMMKLRKPRSKPEEPVVWWDTPELADALYTYCIKDVQVERAVGKKIPFLSKEEQGVWAMDQRINDRGVAADIAKCRRALPILDHAKKVWNKKMVAATGGAVTATTQTAKLVAWINSKGIPCESVAKGEMENIRKKVQDALDEDDNWGAPDVTDAINLRAEANKASTAKYLAFIRGASADDRVRGTLQYHGAATGRWAGRKVQLQNVVRINWETEENLVETTLAVLDMDILPQQAIEAIELLNGYSPFQALSKCLRPIVTAGKGRKLVGADYSNIEGRITAWLADERWKIRAFREYDAGTGPDLYKVEYAKAFDERVSSVDKAMRQIGKVMSLFLGFQGGVGAFQTGAKTVGLFVSDERAEELKLAFREANPRIVKLWRDLEDAAINAVKYKGKEFFAAHGKIKYCATDMWLVCTLPSGRVLHYHKPHLEKKMMSWGKEKDCLFAWGINSFTKKYEPYSLYGGILTENIAQAISACLLRYAMQKAESAGMPVVLTVHDELVCEVDEDSPLGEVDLKNIMEAAPAWAIGLPIAAEPWEGFRYGK